MSFAPPGWSNHVYGGRAPTTATRPTATPFNVTPTAPGQIVPYRPPVSSAIVPSRPTGSSIAPSRPTPTPASVPDYVDAEWSESPATAPTPSFAPPQAKPVDMGPGRPYIDPRTPSKNPVGPYSVGGYPTPSAYPAPPADSRFRDPQEYQDWLNGTSQSDIDRQYYDYNLGNQLNAPGTLNPFGVTLSPQELHNANKYRDKRGLPPIDKHGKPLNQPSNPMADPAKTPFRPDPAMGPRTPVDTSDGYNIDPTIDPDTGQSYPQEVQDAADDQGLRPWAIDPDTLRPWGDPGPQSPNLPFNPFGRAPAGGISRPTSAPQRKLVKESFHIAAYYSAGFAWDFHYLADPGKSMTYSYDSGSGTTTCYVGGVKVASWGDLNTKQPYGAASFSVLAKTPVYADIVDVPGAPEASPFGDKPESPYGEPMPRPLPQPTAPTSPSPYSPTSPAPYSPTSPSPYSPTSPSPYSPTSPSPYSPASPSPYSPASPAPSPRPSPAPTAPLLPGPGTSYPTPRTPYDSPTPVREPWTGYDTGTGTGGGSTTTGTGSPPSACRYAVDQQVAASLKVFKKCGVNGPEFEQISVQVHFAMKASVEAQAERLAAIESQQCESNCIAAVPDSWQMRIQQTPPQLVIQYAEKKGDRLGAPHYSVSIPYYRLSAENTKASLFPAYKKGSHIGIVVLPDNTKIIVNAINGTEAERVLNAFKALVVPERIKGAIESTAKRKGQKLKEVQVYPKIAKYFDGVNPKPVWIKYLA